VYVPFIDKGCRKVNIIICLIRCDLRKSPSCPMYKVDVVGKVKSKEEKWNKNEPIRSSFGK
jgi:hypothetical protein